MAESKELLRNRMLSERDALTPVVVEQKSGFITRHVIESGLLKGGRRIALYSSIRNEVRTDQIFELVQSLQKTLLFPRVSGRKIEFVPVADPKTMIPGHWGILEPHGTPVPLGDIDLVMIPGIAFSEKGHRLGFGRGYYDRAVKGLKAMKVGLGYDFQLLEEIPHDENDLRCDFIFTESQMIRITS